MGFQTSHSLLSSICYARRDILSSRFQTDRINFSPHLTIEGDVLIVYGDVERGSQAGNVIWANDG
jgi:hypothetical protein